MLARPLQLGPVTLETNLMLAPIAGWCELAWRETCRSMGGVGLACTDLLSPQGLICGSEATADLARTSEFDQPIGMQLYGGDPQTLADGARWCAEHGATVVDINMGCPVDKVCKKEGGSQLMRSPELARRIAKAVRAALPDEIPLTAKMRLGWTDADAERNCAGALAVALTEVGVCGITVHGRTTEQLFRGECRREGIRRVVEAVGEATGDAGAGGVPVIGNGDIRSASDVVAMMSETGCAGVMIGRGSFARPWIFREAWEAQLALCQGREAERTEPSEDQKLDLVLAFFSRLREYRSEAHAMHVIRQKISWLGKGINKSHCRSLKDTVRSATTPGQVIEAVEAWRSGSPARV